MAAKSLQRKADLANERMLSMRELAEFCGVPYDTVREWRRRNTGPVGYRIGKHVRYRMRDVEAWLKARADTPQPAA